jgi:hypothetical protein
VAQGLHRVGLEAVVASRLPLSVEGSVCLTESFYGAWTGPVSVRSALIEARRALLKASSWDWASLQLFASVEPPRSRPPLRRRAIMAALGAVGMGALAGATWYLVPKVQPLGGQIVDEAERPLAGARVTLLLPGEEAPPQTETNEQGLFHLELRAAHEAEVRFRAEREGYLPYESSANLGNVWLSFALQRATAP